MILNSIHLRLCNGMLGVFLIMFGSNANESAQFRIVDEEAGGLLSYRKEEKIKRLRKFEC
jgi:hypothetical protein